MRNVVVITGSEGQMSWAQAAAFIVPVVTLAGAVITAAATYGLNQRAARRERLARAFAEALTAIEDYAQMPYRIRRRPGTLEARNQISMELSYIQSRIAFQHSWLHIEAAEVGLQMKEAWTRPAPTADEQMTLEAAYPAYSLIQPGANASRSCEPPSAWERRTGSHPLPCQDDQPQGFCGSTSERLRCAQGGIVNRSNSATGPPTVAETGQPGGKGWVRLSRKRAHLLQAGCGELMRSGVRVHRRRVA